MDYLRIYNQIIQKARAESRRKGADVYYEAHHIVPRCLGGDGNTKQWRSHPNIILLTAREHFICHRLLHNAYPDNPKLAQAFWIMCKLTNPKQHRHVPSSRTVEQAKLAMATSKRGGEGYWKGRVVSEERKHSISKALTGRKRSEEVKLKTEETKRKNDSYQRQAEKLKGRKLSIEHKQKIKEARMLNPHKHSDAVKALMKKPKPIVECPHCDKVGGKPQMMQWHFTNCKHKKD